jgi:hypothetical protein
MSTGISNAPESEALSSQEVTTFENARQAAITLKKTFETWLVIGRSVVEARKIAERRGGRKTFMRIIEQQELGRIVDKATASRLERIMRPENLPSVLAWHKTLTERQQIDWAGPTTILRHCPVFTKAKIGDRPASPFQKLRDVNIQLAEENYRLRQREDGDTFNAKASSPREIAAALFGQLQPYRGKARKVASELMALIAADAPV